MRPFWPRFIRHAIAVGICLAAIGYVLAQAFLLTHRMYAGTAYSSENERVLWQTPLVMAVLGIAITAGLDLLTGLVRKPAPVPLTPSSTDSVA